ncbi:MAG: glycosyltransferase family 2 protein, partial [Methanoregula sp.]|nr:glycosyltransferase family 2 protein [Methanoregula sp.]
MSLSVSDIILPQNVPRKSGDVRSPAGAVIQAASEKTGIAGKEIVAVIPAYNEELVIGSVVLKARQYVNKVIVVDDGSRDQTRNVAEMAGAEVIALEKNGGKANALFVGLRRAREEGCRAAVIIDGDGQHKAQDIPQVMSPVLNGNADMVIGSRFLSHNNDVPAYRRLGQKTLDVFTNFGCGYRVTDSQSGFRAFSRKALENMDFNSKGYGIESDMIAHFAKRGLSICEVPISVRYDVPHKHKKNPLSHGFSVLGSI